MQAYLVIRDGARWTDVFRLEVGRRFLIGRASTNHIVIRDDRASRQHAELFEKAGHWVIRDLQSRNGTVVDERTIQGDHRLEPGQTIVLAGCHMTFVEQLADAFEKEFSARPDSGDQQTAEVAARGRRPEGDEPSEDDLESAQIVKRQKRLALLESASSGPAAPAAPGIASSLARIAFTLARCDSPTAAATAALAAVTQEASVANGAVLVLAPAAPAAAQHLTVVATRQPEGRGYHRLTDVLAQQVLRDGEALLVRNLRGDAQLVRQDSHGQFSTTSAICAPIRQHGEIRGILHIYSSDTEPQLTPDRLELVLGVAENLGLALTNLQQKIDLTQSLKQSRRQLNQLREQLHDRQLLIGNSPALQAVRRAIEMAGPTGATVLIRGESGVGKELVAAALHAHSPRRDEPFVCLNCAALSPTLLESELFGHEKGAFTGATERKIGKFEAADGGTLMLDEIGEMNLEIQAKFLRVLEGHPFERVGGNAPLRANVRVLAATNRDLEQAIREGKFRADLYFRLQVLELLVPPLRERIEDIEPLAEHFAARFAREMGRRIDGLTPEARAKLRVHHWPGNVRELRNAIERAVVLCPGPQIDDSDLVLTNLQLEPLKSSAAAPPPAESDLVSLEELERHHIYRTLAATGGNKSRAASLLGIERSTLDRKLKRYEEA